MSLASEYAKAAMSYQYAADNKRKYGHPDRVSIETIDLRALGCWGAAIKGGIVTG